MGGVGVEVVLKPSLGFLVGGISVPQLPGQKSLNFIIKTQNGSPKSSMFFYWLSKAWRREFDALVYKRCASGAESLRVSCPRVDMFLFRCLGRRCIKILSTTSGKVTVIHGIWPCQVLSGAEAFDFRGQFLSRPTC